MSELRALVEAARQLRDTREPFLSATVVRVRGSGYRRPGARMLASQDRWLAGSISGGCLERDVMAKGFWRTRNESALLVTYDQAEDALDERSGSGCQGVVDVLLERHAANTVGECDVFAAAERCIRDESVAAMVTVFRSTRADVPIGARWLAQDGELRCTHDTADLGAGFAREIETALATCALPWVTQRTAAEGEVEALVECLLPPPHLFVFGSGHDVSPLITLVKNLGWTASVWDALPRTATRARLRAADHYLTGKVEDAVAKLERCVRPAAVIMGHHLEQDRASLAALVPSSARYVGVLGPRLRTEQMLADCRAAGVRATDGALARVHAPVGLQLGAQTPAEIALAIVAEAQAALTSSDASALRSQPGAIHRQSIARLPSELGPWSARS
jgi:xanthine/CO dehydrogenase XdhC/CoxF family maturation factor